MESKVSKGQRIKEKGIKGTAYQRDSVAKGREGIKGIKGIEGTAKGPDVFFYELHLFLQ